MPKYTHRYNNYHTDHSLGARGSSTGSSEPFEYSNGQQRNSVVWIEVLIDDQQTITSSIVVEEGDSMDIIKERITITCRPEFDSVPTTRIDLFKSVKDIQQEKPPLDALEQWNSNVTWGTDKLPLIVKVKRDNVSALINRKALEKAIEKHFSTPISPFQKENELHLYMIDGDNGVMGQQAWIEQLPTRFTDGLTNGILYRPEIVNEIIAKVEENLSKPVAQGLMIKGPQGIGKSHSIVSVVRKLQSTGNYLVTFIPDCESWDISDDLINAICRSIGTSATSIGIRKYGNYREVLLQLIEDVTKVLVKTDKQWVFVFDQINRLFARFPGQKDVGVLYFPYRLIKQVMARGRITSIISASANNEIADKDFHPGFEEYFHRIAMTDDEIQLVFSAVIDDEKQSTGNVPLYISQLRSGREFASTLQTSVMFSLGKLRRQTEEDDKSTLTDNMCQILLRQTFPAPLLLYDRKYFVEVYDETQNKWSYRPLSPLMEDAAREFFWEDLMQYFNVNERSMLQVMNKHRTTYDTKGRIFDGLVIQRCRENGVNLLIDGASIGVEARAFDFRGNTLPTMLEDGVYVPTNYNFPAVDMVWKAGKRVFGVQVHISSGIKIVDGPFWNLCEEANWFSEYEIYLVYLSPNEKCAMKQQKSEYVNKKKRGGGKKEISIRYITISSVDCLMNLPISNRKL